MDEPIEKILNDIADDRQSGATALAARALDALAILADRLSDDDIEAGEQVFNLVRRIDRLRPVMGAIGAQALLVADGASGLVEDGLTWSAAVGRVVTEAREKLCRSDREIAALVLESLGSGGVLVTCSHSQTVHCALSAIRPDLVRIGDGYPLGDGIRAARALMADDIQVEIFPDGALAAAVPGARAVLIGADQILGDGSVINRAGSLSLALAAHHYGVPFVVACQSIKLSGGFRGPDEEASDRLLDVPAGALARVPVFDTTPGEFVHRVFTQDGSLTPKQAVRMGRRVAELRARIAET